MHVSRALRKTGWRWTGSQMETGSRQCPHGTRWDPGPSRRVDEFVYKTARLGKEPKERQL